MDAQQYVLCIVLHMLLPTVGNTQNTQLDATINRKIYCFVVQTLLNMFRALLCPSSGAHQTALAASGFRMNVEVEVFSAVVGLLMIVASSWVFLFERLNNTVNTLHVEVSFQRCLLGGLSELSALSERHYFFITRYSMKQGNVLQTAGCSQSVSTFICKQHSA